MKERIKELLKKIYPKLHLILGIITAILALLAFPISILLLISKEYIVLILNLELVLVAFLFIVFGEIDKRHNLTFLQNFFLDTCLINIWIWLVCIQILYTYIK